MHHQTVTRKLFWDDPYQTRLETRVRSVLGAQVTLYETIFYAFSGGQESDAGTIQGRPVLKAEKRGLDILYTLSEAHGLSVEDPVLVEIDWQRRYRLMRLHFAAEVVLELVNLRWPGVAKIGAHIAEDKARIDFALDQNITPHLAPLQQQIREIVASDRAIISDFSDAPNQRRYWELPGFARIACGGTHLRRTSEVGEVTLKRKNIGKGKERVEIYPA